MERRQATLATLDKFVNDERIGLNVHGRLSGPASDFSEFYE